MLLAEIIVAVCGLEGRAGAQPAAQSRRPTQPNIVALGQLLYSRYLFPFEIAGLILLVAMIGAIVLTHRSRGDTRAAEGVEAGRPPAGGGGQATRSPASGEGMKL